MTERGHVTIVAHAVGGIGGMESQLARLVAGLAARGHAVTVVARSCRLPEPTAARWVRVAGPARPFPLAYLWFFVAGTLQVARHRRGVVHTTGAIVLNRADVSTVHYCHHAGGLRTRLDRTRRFAWAFAVNGWAARLFSLLAERICFSPSRTSALVAVSAQTAEDLRIHFPQMAARISVIPNSVDRSEFARQDRDRAAVRGRLGLEEDSLLALFVGGDWGRKGLIHAVRALSASTRWHLCVVGAGPVAAYAGLAQSLGLAARVHFVGARPHVSPYYSAADALILPSAYESFSLVTFEAAAAGLPLLATRTGAIPDILHDGQNGWFIRPDPRDIGRRLVTLAAHPDVRERMAAASERLSHRHSGAAMVSAYDDLYRASPAHRRPSRPAAAGSTAP
jgi:UDP-glucose:(heptosyl)LPS alpha-1,3-glucosyltransferase